MNKPATNVRITNGRRYYWSVLSQGWVRMSAKPVKYNTETRTHE